MAIRSFLSFPISGKFKEALESILNKLQCTDAHVTWVKPENLHLTLKFLGNIKESDIENIVAVLKDRCRSFASITSYLSKIEIFPDLHRPRIVWATLDDSNKEFETMVNALEGELVKFGIAKENHSFKPHITMGRVKSLALLNNLMRTINEIKFDDKIQQTFDRILLCKSTLTSQGSIYEELGKWDLVKAKV